MKNPDEKLLKALIRLGGDNDFKLVIEWVKESLEIQKNNLIDDNSDRPAGAAEEVREIFDKFDKPKEILDKLNAVQSRRPNP